KAGRLQDAVQHASLFLMPYRNINVVILDDRKLRQYCIAVMPVRIDCIAPISELRPYGVSKKFILTGRRPTRQGFRMAVVRAQHFLQEDNVSPRGTYGVSQLMKNETPVQRSEALVCIDSQ